MVIDSHCHLADKAFESDLPSVAARAQAAGVSVALCILSADEADEVARAGAVQAAWPAVQFAAGVHPHRAAACEGGARGAAAAALRALEQTNAVALGEIGLDYHYDFSPRPIQRDVFAAQLAVAAERDLPVIIHTREAGDDTMAMLRAASPRVRGVMHCFSGTADEAREALDLGFYLSLSGILTFPKAGSLREIAAFVPEDRLLVETDAPYLAPVPHRGKRNEPAWVAETLQVLAMSRQMPSDELASRLAMNFQNLFGARAFREGGRVDTPSKDMV